MLLCKVLQGSASEVGAILAGKWGVKHTGAELDAMSEVAKSAKNRCGGVSVLSLLSLLLLSFVFLALKSMSSI